MERRQGRHNELGEAVRGRLAGADTVARVNKHFQVADDAQVLPPMVVRLG